MNRFEIRYRVLDVIIRFAFYFYLAQGIFEVNAVKTTVGIGLVLYYHLRLKKSIFKSLNEQEKEWKAGNILKNGEIQVVGESAKSQWEK